ncbi:EF-hand domain-containing protein [Sphingobium sp. AN558]|uniref:EF-hand domain-containing protein n=1 Tax=Sphingobium sp. AN558 TaxID=3133442 RepID=UPI0030BCE7E8
MIRRFFGTVALGSLFVGGLAASHLAFAQPDGRDGAHGPRGGGLMALVDANKDGAITRAELTAALEARFAKLDANKDGKLTREDREARRAERLDARFAALDTDRNGQVSKAEFVAGAQARHDRQNADGRPGGPEGRRWGGRHHGGPGGGMMMGPGRDAGKDGVVTKAEFMAGPLAMFDKADANHDGTVSADELKAARETMRGQMRGKWHDRKGPPPPAG